MSGVLLLLLSPSLSMIHITPSLLIGRSGSENSSRAGNSATGADTGTTVTTLLTSIIGVPLIRWQARHDSSDEALSKRRSAQNYGTECVEIQRH